MRIAIVLGPDPSWIMPAAVVRALSALPEATVVVSAERRTPVHLAAQVEADLARAPAVLAADVVLTENLVLDPPPPGLHLRLFPPSRHGSAIGVEHALMPRETGRASGAALALTSVIWEETDVMPVTWRIELGAPITGPHLEELRRCAGRNALVAAQQLSPERREEAEAAVARLRDALPGWALHVHGSMYPDMDPIEGLLVWPADGAGVWPLLGKMDLVVADPGALAWDAARLGIPVRELGLLSSDRSVERLLADVVPAGLAADPEFWRRALSTLIRCRDKREPAPPLLQASALRRWRDESFRPPLPSGGSVLRRRLAKLLRNPRLFCRDSRFPLLRWLAG